jgi:hypothetical protein
VFLRLDAARSNIVLEVVRHQHPTHAELVKGSHVREIPADCLRSLKMKTDTEPCGFLGCPNIVHGVDQNIFVRLQAQLSAHPRHRGIDGCRPLIVARHRQGDVRKPRPAHFLKVIHVLARRRPEQHVA